MAKVAMATGARLWLNPVTVCGRKTAHAAKHGNHEGLQKWLLYASKALYYHTFFFSVPKSLQTLIAYVF